MLSKIIILTNSTTLMKYFKIILLFIMLSAVAKSQTILGNSRNYNSNTNDCIYTTFNGAESCGSDQVPVAYNSCCPVSKPFYCPKTGSCYSTCEGASGACNGDVIKAGTNAVIQYPPDTYNNVNNSNKQNEVIQYAPEEETNNHNSEHKNVARYFTWSVVLSHKISVCQYCSEEFEEIIPIKITSNGDFDGEIAVLEAADMYPNQAGKTNFINDDCKAYNNPASTHQLIIKNKFTTSKNKSGSTFEATDVQNAIKNNFNEIERSIFVNNCLQFITLAITAGK